MLVAHTSSRRGNLPFFGRRSWLHFGQCMYQALLFFWMWGQQPKPDRSITHIQYNNTSQPLYRATLFWSAKCKKNSTGVPYLTLLCAAYTLQNIDKYRGCWMLGIKFISFRTYWPPRLFGLLDMRNFRGSPTARLQILVGIISLTCVKLHPPLKEIVIVTDCASMSIATVRDERERDKFVGDGACCFFFCHGFLSFFF